MNISEAMRLGMEHHQAGRLMDAEKLYREVLRIQPGNAEALHLLGMLAGQVGKMEAAADLMRQTIELDPGNAIYHQNLGAALASLGKKDEAIEAFRRAIALKPDDVTACFDLGNLLMAQGNPDGAVASFRRVLELKPDYAEAHFNLGNGLRARGELDAAVTSYRKAIALKLNIAEVHNNLGGVLAMRGDVDGAIASYRQALTVNPDSAEAHFNLGIALLLTGHFQEGWEGYEWRLKVEKFKPGPRRFPQPEWDGGDLGGRTILLHMEQGHGDAIQFIRYASRVAGRGGKVVVLAFPEIHRLLEKVPGVDQVVSRYDQVPAFEVHCPLPNLPRVFGTTLENIPAEVPYVSADPELASRWSGRMGTGDRRRRVGLAWAGRPDHWNDRLRSMAPSVLVPLAGVKQARFFSLQKGDAGQAQVLAEAGMELTDWTKDLGDFSDTAALVANLDLVITVDTAVAHLAGAMGKPVWVMLPFVPDWRWMLDRLDSPWYPTMRLFRQPELGDWSSVVERVAAELRGEL